MSNTEKLSKDEAIRRVIAEGSALDYVDVVDEVRKQFGIKVSTGLVEKVYLELKRRGTQLNVEPRLQMDIPSPSEPATAVIRSPAGSEKVESEGNESTSRNSHLLHALTFVKSVNGLSNAKAALAELEAIMGKDV